MRGEDPAECCSTVSIVCVMLCLRWLPAPLLPQDERGAAALHTVALDDKYGGAPVQVRVVQYKEPEHFLQIFRGKMVIHAVSVCTWQWVLLVSPTATLSSPSRVGGPQASRTALRVTRTTWMALASSRSRAPPP